jgi:hypothetical protein
MPKVVENLRARVARQAISRAKGCEPDYDPGSWNNDFTSLTMNNCYNYACDTKTNTFAQPGRGSGDQYSAFDCDEVRAGAVSDGLATKTCSSSCNGGCSSSACRYKVALVIWPGVDFHWYRQDKGGAWSHKPGQGPATNVDNAGATISDPSTADTGPYTVFCGCMCVKKSGLTLD